jgi:homoserine acetyltransferase
VLLCIPIILINHALTGNSQVIGESVGGMISWELTKHHTRKYTIVSFDVPGMVSIQYY